MSVILALRIVGIKKPENLFTEIYRLKFIVYLAAD